MVDFACIMMFFKIYSRFFKTLPPMSCACFDKSCWSRRTLGLGLSLLFFLACLQTHASGYLGCSGNCWKFCSGETAHFVFCLLAVTAGFLPQCTFILY